ncbi:hypothetical protein F4780DRAFT_743860 [Xylariomycetidae sp. FL0641]|nr:hypothetical protein F4780DRAFT_743860 [Xylariomycetidae sp. FL0641]
MHSSFLSLSVDETRQLEKYCLSVSTDLSDVLKQHWTWTRDNFADADRSSSLLQAQWMMQRARNRKAKRVLDIGCYTGLSAMAMYEGTRETQAELSVPPFRPAVPSVLGCSSSDPAKPDHHHRVRRRASPRRQGHVREARLRRPDPGRGGPSRGHVRWNPACLPAVPCRAALILQASTACAAPSISSSSTWSSRPTSPSSASSWRGGCCTSTVSCWWTTVSRSARSRGPAVADEMSTTYPVFARGFVLGSDNAANIDAKAHGHWVEAGQIVRDFNVFLKENPSLRVNLLPFFDGIAEVRLGTAA